jgi:hypothetical protein
MEYTGYLFAHFIGEAQLGEQVYFASSRDGLHWKDLNSGNPVLISDIGEKGVRDPFIIRDVLNGKYIIIATDLCIASGKGWWSAQHYGSTNIIVWESKDLVNWSEPLAVNMRVPGAGCVWAPEAIFDESRQEFLVFWASMVTEPSTDETKQRIYASYTKDFHEFSDAFLYKEGKFHIIDTTIIKVGKKYYRFSKNETENNIILEKSENLDKCSFEQVMAPTLNSIQGVEGPAAFKFNDRDEWCVLVDRFAEDKGYLPLLSHDFESGEFRTPSEREYDMGSNKKRHGSILNLTETELRAIEDKWGK